MTARRSRSSSRRLAAAAVAAAAFVLGAAPAAEARSFVIKARGSASSLGEVLRIGDFRPARDATLGAAIAAYGKPSTVRGGGSSCRVRWRRLGVEILFVNLGGGGARASATSVAPRPPWFDAAHGARARA